MHPLAYDEFCNLRSRQPDHWALQFLLRAQSFAVSTQMHDFAGKIAKNESDQYGIEDDLPMPLSSELPAAETVLIVANYVVVLCWRPDSDPSAIDVSLLKHGLVVPAVRFWPGKADLLALTVPGHPERDRLLREDDRAKAAWELAFILSLINTPRLTQKQVTQAPRHVRRRMERMFAAPAKSYITVSWTIGRATRVTPAADMASDFRQPLHWRRAHYTRAKEGQPKAEWIKRHDTGEWGWWRWTSECWAGHPDYGIKLHQYQPRAPGEDRRLGALRPSFGPSADKLAILDAQARHAVEAAGFA